MAYQTNSWMLIQENPFQNVAWKMAAILSRPQCVNTLRPDKMAAISENTIRTGKFSSKTRRIKWPAVYHLVHEGISWWRCVVLWNIMFVGLIKTPASNHNSFIHLSFINHDNSETFPGKLRRKIRISKWNIPQNIARKCTRLHWSISLNLVFIGSSSLALVRCHAMAWTNDDILSVTYE